MALSYTQASQIERETPAQTKKITAPTLNTYQQATAAPVVSTPVLNSVQPAIVNRPPTDDLAYQSVLNGNNYLAKKAKSDYREKVTNAGINILESTLPQNSYVGNMLNQSASELALGRLTYMAEEQKRKEAEEAQRVAAAQAASKRPTDDLAYQSLVSGNNYLAKKEAADYREKVTNAGIDILNYTLPQNSYVGNMLDRSSAEIALGRLSYMAEKEAKEAEEQARKEAEEAEKARQEYLQNRNIFQKAWTAIGAGAGQFNSSVAQFVNMAATGVETAEAWLNGGFTSDGKFVKGEAPFTGSLFQPIHDWANWTTSTANKLSEENRLQAKTAAGKTANEIAAGVIAAAPQAVLALMTMGGSTAGTLATQSAGMTNSVNAALSRLSSNPSYWASFVQEAGGNFAEAKANGATDEQAITAATISGLANAMIEVGGGIEDNAWLNDDTLTKLQKARKLAGSALGEGKEELIQNPITRATQKLVYDKDKAWFSLTDEDAVINPKASAKEFAMGTAVGGILSGANFAINSAVNAATKANINNSAALRSAETAAQPVVSSESILDKAIMQTISDAKPIVPSSMQETLVGKALGVDNMQTTEANAIVSDTQRTNISQNPISQAQSVITAPQTIAENAQENTASNVSLDEAIMSALEPANAQAEKNAAPIAEADSTVINDDPDVHTEQEQRIIEEYKNSAYMNKEGASHSVDTDNLSRRNGATVSENAPGNNVAQESKNVNAAGAARTKMGPYVESQNKTLDKNRYSTEEEINAVPRYVHERVSNALQMERANGQLLTDASGSIVRFDEQVNDLLGKERWDNLDRDVAVLLREEAWNRNDMDKWRALSDKITDTNTEAGKTLQGTQKWIEQEKPAQAVVRAAEKVLETASNKVDKAGIDQFIVETGKRIDGIDRQARSNPNGTYADDYGAVLLEIAKKRKMVNAKHFVDIAITQGKNDINWLRSMVYNGLYNVAADYEKPTDVTGGLNKGLRRLKSFVITNQLFRVTTNVANVISNTASNMTESAANVQAFANLADLAMSASTGTRSHGFENVFSKRAIKTGHNFAQKSIAEIWLDTSTEATDSKFQQSRGRSVREHKMTGNKFFSVVDAVLSTALNTTDAFSTGVSQGAVEQSLQKKIERAKITAENAADVAEQRGLDTTFHNKTILGNALTKMSSAANAGLEFGAGNIVFGNYLNVPAAIIAREASKMPTIGTIGALANMAVVITDSQINKHTGASANSDVGKYGKFGSLLNKMSGEDLTITQRQARAAQQFGRAIGGGAIEIAAFVAMASRGWVKRFDDEDKDKAAYDTAMGNQGLMINWSAIIRDMKGESTEWQAGDIRWSLGRLEPLIINMNLGIDVAEILQNDEVLTSKDAVKLSVDALESGISDLSMIQNLQAIIDGLKYKSEDESAFENIGKTIIENNITSLTPGLVQQAAKASDPYYRDLYTGDTFGQQLLDDWKSTIPVLRQTLPVKLTGEGKPKEYAGTRSEQIVNSLLNPYSQTTQKENPRQDFLEKYDAIPPKNSVSKISVDGEYVALDPAQKRTYLETFGASYNKLTDALQASDAFNGLPENVQKLVVKNAESFATALGKEATGVGYTSSDWKDESLDDLDGAINSMIIKAVSAANRDFGYLSDDLKSGYDNAKSAISALDGLPEEVRKAAADKAQEYFLAVEKSKYGKELEKSQAELANLSEEELSNYFVSKAIESSKYLSEENGKKYDLVAKRIDASFGLSDELKEKAAEKTKNYYISLEQSKYGTELSDTNKELDGLSYSELADYFVNKAVKDRYTDENKSGSNWDELSDALQKNEIDDATVFAVLPEEQTIAYDRWGKTAGVSAQQWLDALSFHNSEAGKTEYDDDDVEIVSAKDKLQNYIDGQSGMSQEQKDAVMRGFYNDNPATYKYLVSAINSGEITPEAAKKELTPSQQSGWSHNVKQTGASMANYISAVDTYIEAPNEDERKKLGYKSKWEWYVDELNKTGLNQQQKYAIFISMNGSISDKNKAVAYGKLK